MYVGMYDSYTHNLKENIGFRTIGVTENCEPSYIGAGNWSYQVLLEQQAHLNAELSIQLCKLKHSTPSITH